MAAEHLITEWMRNGKRHLLAAATKQVKQQFNPKHWQVFHFYALQRWAPREVVRVLRVSVARAYLVKHWVGALIRGDQEFGSGLDLNSTPGPRAGQRWNGFALSARGADETPALR
jgi:hypothetical protein